MYSWRFYGQPDGYTVIEHHAPDIVDANGFQLYKNAEVYRFDDQNAFKWISSNWTRNNVDFRIYAIWATKSHGIARPPIVVEPNEPIVDPNDISIIILPTVWVSQTGTKYHSVTCRYWNTSFHTISIFDALLTGCTPCAVCKPNEHLSD